MRINHFLVCPFALLLIAPVQAQNRSVRQMQVRSLANTSELRTQVQHDVVSNITFLIGINVRMLCVPWSIRGISVFLDPQSFTIDNLTSVFRYLSERYPSDETLDIWVFRDMSKFLENARGFLAKQDVPFDERFSGANDYFEPPGKTGIHALYIRSGTREGFTYYPGKGQRPNVYMKLKSTPVHFALSGDSAVDLVEAAKFGYTDVVKDILDGGVDVNIKTKYGSGALADATCIGQVEAVRLLLERGADVNQTSSSGWTALMCAITLGRDKILDILLSHWPDVNARTEDGMTALMLAVRKGSPGIVRELLARGADPSVEDVYGRTALSIAEKRHRVEIIRLIKEAMSTSRI